MSPMKRMRVLSAAVALGLIVVLSVGSTASAFQLLKLTGHHGDFGTALSHADTPDAPGARCGYSAPDSSGFAHLAWIRVFPFKASAYDRTTGVDQQRIRFTATMQRSGDGGATWTSVGSVAQTRTATDTSSAAFDSLKVVTTGRSGKLYRTIAKLEWLRNGATDGLARVRMQYYSVNWTVGDPAYVYTDACEGAAD
jgi:hypothetical protein